MSTSRKDGGIPAKLVVFGAGGIGELAHYYFTNDSRYEVVGFTADGDRITDATFNGLPVVPFETVERDYPSDRYATRGGTRRSACRRDR